MHADEAWEGQREHLEDHSCRSASVFLCRDLLHLKLLSQLPVAKAFERHIEIQWSSTEACIQHMEMAGTGAWRVAFHQTELLVGYRFCSTVPVPVLVCVSFNVIAQKSSVVHLSPALDSISSPDPSRAGCVCFLLTSVGIYLISLE